jgi:hypothetical protein
MWADSSDQIDALAASLVKALGEMHDLPKTQTANVGKFNYSYATLADALQLARPIFAKHDLALTQTVATLNNEIAVYTTVIHSSGQFVTPFPLTMPVGKTAQETGSAATYGRRYSLMAVLGLATEDDDGASAGPRVRRETTRTPSKPREEPEGRTQSETEIRRMLGALSKDEVDTFRADFVGEFGVALKDLEPTLHEAAHAWVQEWIFTNA